MAMRGRLQLRQLLHAQQRELHLLQAGVAQVPRLQRGGSVTANKHKFTARPHDFHSQARLISSATATATLRFSFPVPAGVDADDTAAACVV
uniref:Uncharacterized protein n=1 Tax=Arundo donax TaxID=35708 RepID=A0A0A9AKQ3_ARUDO